MILLGATLGVLWIGALVLAALDGRKRWVLWLATGVLAAGTVLVAVVAGRTWATGEPVGGVVGGWPADVGIRLRADALGAPFALVSMLVLLAAQARDAVEGIGSRARPALMAFLAVGLTGLFVTGDGFSFYVFFELAMIAAYGMAAAGAGPQRLRSAFVFAVVNLIGTFLFLVGIAALYRVTGTLAMEAVAARLDEVEQATALVVGAVLFVAFAVKLGLFPFHPWLPPIYTSASAVGAAVLAGALANIGAYGVLRFGGELLDRETRLAAPVLIGLGLASILYGSVQALNRPDARELLAYSTIGQAGYVLVGLGVGGPVGLAAAALFAIVNGATKAALFLAHDLRGAIAGGAFLVGTLSVVGMPPSGGFFGKTAMLGAGVEAGAATLALLVVGALLPFVYLFRCFQRLYWRADDDDEPRTSWGLVAPAAGLAALLFAAGVWPEPLLALAREAAAVLGSGA